MSVHHDQHSGRQLQGKSQGELTLELRSAMTQSLSNSISCSARLQDEDKVLSSHELYLVGTTSAKKPGAESHQGIAHDLMMHMYVCSLFIRCGKEVETSVDLLLAL